MGHTCINKDGTRIFSAWHQGAEKDNRICSAPNVQCLDIRIARKYDTACGDYKNCTRCCFLNFTWWSSWGCVLNAVLFPQRLIKNKSTADIYLVIFRTILSTFCFRSFFVESLPMPEVKTNQVWSERHINFRLPFLVDVRSSLCHLQTKKFEVKHLFETHQFLSELFWHISWGKLILKRIQPKCRGNLSKGNNRKIFQKRFFRYSGRDIIWPPEDSVGLNEKLSAEIEARFVQTQASSKSQLQSQVMVRLKPEQQCHQLGTKEAKSSLSIWVAWAVTPRHWVSSGLITRKV